MRIALAALTLAIAATPAHAQGTYEFTNLTGDGYLVTDINNRGDTIGNVTAGGQRGWVRRGDQYFVLQYLIPSQEPGGQTYGSQYSSALDINDKGAIVGTATSGRTGRIFAGRHAVVWRPFADGNTTPTKPFDDLGTMAEGTSDCNYGPPEIECYTEGVAINESDDVVGRGEAGYKSGRGFYTLPFRSLAAAPLAKGTGTSPSPNAVTTAGTTNLGASGINDSGQVVVWTDPAVNGGNDPDTSALYTAGAHQSIPFATRAAYHPINNSGWVIGSTTTGPDSAKLWRAGTTTTLPPLPGDTEANALAINNNGDVVGESWGAADGCHRAVKWPANDFANPIDLQARTATTWKLYRAHAINDRGDIVGGGRTDGLCTGSYQLRPYKLSFPGLVVNDAGDEPDSSGGSGICDAKADPGEQCTLRAAIQTVNSGSARQRMTFTVSAIAPLTPLPAITRPVELRGAGVVIDGAGAGATDGLRVEGGESLLDDLVVKNFQGDGIHLASSDNVVGDCEGTCAAMLDNGGSGVSVAAGEARNSLRGLRLDGNGVLAIDIGDDGRTANTDAVTDFPVGVSETLRPTGWSLSGRAPRAPAGSEVDIYAQSLPGRAAPYQFVKGVDVQATGWFGATGDGPNPVTRRFYSATVTTPDGTTSELSAVCGDTDADGDPDNDRDGLCDDWEGSGGLDYDDDGTVDLQFPGSDPEIPDVYLELDAMEDLAGETARPDSAAFDRVRAAFANAPDDVDLKLHMDDIDETVRAQSVVKFDGLTGSDTVQAIRNGAADEPCDGSFGTVAERSGPNCWKTIGAKRLTWRWGLFGYAFDERQKASGIAQLGGDTLIVTVARWGAKALLSSGGAPGQCVSLAACRTNIEAATLMHELGHLIGLKHGGAVHENYKPNYLSIMNYAFQHQDLVADRPLDYSREQLPTLNEQSLLEPAGIGAPPAAAARWPRTVIAETLQPGCIPGNVVKEATRVGVLTTGPADFNQDGDTTDTVVDRLLRGESCFPELMEGHDDWHNLQYSFRGTSDVLAGVFLGADARELTDEEALAVAAQTDIDGDGVSNLDESCALAPGSGFADVNANGIADVCETAVVPDPTATASPSAVPTATATASPGPPPAGDTVAPRITGAKLAKRGRTLTFTLSEAAAVKVTTVKLVAGRKKGKRCVAGRKKGKRCTVKRAAGGKTAAGVAGANSVGLRKLGKGRYQVTVAATDAAGNRAAPVTLALRVKKR